MQALKLLLVILLSSYFTPLNATSKNEKKKIISLFGTDESVVASKKTTPKLIKLFDNVPDIDMPKYQTTNLPKYYSKEPAKEIAKENTATKTPEKPVILKVNDWKKDDMKLIEFDEETKNEKLGDKLGNKLNTKLAEQVNNSEDDELDPEKIKPFKFDKDSNYYDKVTKMVKNAFSLIGSAYKFGSQNRDRTYDCSLFTQRTFAKIGLHLPRSSIEQSELGKRVSKENLIVGDLLFFTTYRKSVSHVGIYIGDNKMIHASTQKGVTVDDLDDSYYKKRYLFAKRPNFAYEDYAGK